MLEPFIRVRRGRARRAAPLLDALLDHVDESFPPAADLVVLDREGPWLRVAAGSACAVGEPVAADAETRYDLASLTKVVATTTAALRLAQEGRWRLDDPVSRWVEGYPREDVTLRHLLTHRSGLLAHRPYFETCEDEAAVRAAVLADAANSGAIGPVLYSDLGFMVLGWALSAAAAQPLERAVREMVTQPLTMTTARYRPPRSWRRHVAATELDGDQRTEPGLVWGEVHDGNAHAMGGVSGHAGLFARADDLALFVGALLDPSTHPVLSSASIEEMSRLQSDAEPEARGLGWRLEPEGWGDWAEGTLWHTGFTGTSLLVDRRRQVAVVLLTNAVHPRRDLARQAEFRALLHRLASEAVA